MNTARILYYKKTSPCQRPGNRDTRKRRKKFGNKKSGPFPARRVAKEMQEASSPPQGDFQLGRGTFPGAKRARVSGLTMRSFCSVT